jgi:hypothetical protein
MAISYTTNLITETENSGYSQGLDKRSAQLFPVSGPIIHWRLRCFLASSPIPKDVTVLWVASSTV